MRRRASLTAEKRKQRESEAIDELRRRHAAEIEYEREKHHKNINDINQKLNEYK
jgi:hypothetical protein